MSTELERARRELETRLIRAETVEACARIADEEAKGWAENGFVRPLLARVAKAIRALAPSEDGPRDGIDYDSLGRGSILRGTLAEKGSK